MKYIDIKNGRFYLGDCLEVMKQIPDGVVDMIMCDLPYGMVDCEWDSVLPFDILWQEYNRICKNNAAMVFTAIQPFTTLLIGSNLKNFKYSLVWDKVKPSNWLNAKKQPLRSHEDIIIFANASTFYSPQMEIGKRRVGKSKSTRGKGAFEGKTIERVFDNNGLKYPKSIINISNAEQSNKLHPTQKPVALFEYLIRTYTNEGQLVLDNTAGSGTTAIACINSNRKWVCIEKDETYANKAIERIMNHEVEMKPVEEKEVAEA